MDRRAEAVRALCGQLAEEHGIEVWPHYFNAGDTWEIDWEYRGDGHPTVDEVRAALRAHPGAAPYASSIRLSTAVGDVIRTARACLEPGAAVVVDTETTGLHGGGVVVEIPVVDASTGTVLLDTLVHRDGVEVQHALGQPTAEHEITCRTPR